MARSGTGDNNLEHLKKLQFLKYLNVSETNVTSRGLILNDILIYSIFIYNLNMRVVFAHCFCGD
jgi:hypothetical protein